MGKNFVKFFIKFKNKVLSIEIIFINKVSYRIIIVIIFKIFFCIYKCIELNFYVFFMWYLKL